jgi:putative ABC transport system permease protein
MASSTDMPRNLPGAEAMTVFTNPNGMPIYDNGRRVDTYVRRTDGQYWRILDFRFLEGGPFTEEENRNATPAAVISRSLASKLFPAVSGVGRSITVDGQTFKVVGIVDDVPVTRVVAFSEIWLPVRTLKTPGWEKQTLGSFNAVVLARSRADFAPMRAEFERRVKGFVSPDSRLYDRAEAGLDTPFEAFARSVFGRDFDPGKATLLKLILVGAGLLFMILPTMNLISINLSRIMERASEIGVRKAFGASSRSLVGQFVIENVVLTLIGGAISIVLAAVALRLINAAQIMPHADLTLNLRIFGWGMLIAAFFGIVSGAWPAWRMSRMHAVEALRGGVL